MSEKPKAPVFLSASEWEAMWPKFKGSNNLDWLLTCVCWYVRDNLFRAYHSSDPASTSIDAIRRIGETLYRAILDRLKANLPKDADRDEATLVRWYPERTAVILEQALGFLNDVWKSDFEQHPLDILSVRCRRLLPQLAQLPNMKGRSIHGDTSRLFTLEIYEMSMELLEHLPSVKKNLTPADSNKRTEVFNSVLDLLQHDAKRTDHKFPLVINQIFSKAAKKNYQEWLSLPRNDVALQIAIRASQNAGYITPKYLLRLIPDLRNKAARLKELLDSIS